MKLPSDINDGKVLKSWQEGNDFHYQSFDL